MDPAKAALSASAANELLKKNIQCLGIGSGTTIQFFIEELSRTTRKFIVVPTSTDTEIRVSSKEFCLSIESSGISPDLVIDGTDEIERTSGWLLKGGGGALTREKIVAYSAKEFWILADISKMVEKLGSKRSIPVEVLPFGWKRVKHLIEKLGGKSELRQASEKLGPVITDNGNYLLDFQPARDWNPKEMEQNLKLLPGVVENGIFTRAPDRLFLSDGKTVKILSFKATEQLTELQPSER
ncbi:MAG: ribose 5-phosphate isomerase A [Candidatus Hodarchaeales archaeon]